MFFDGKILPDFEINLKFQPRFLILYVSLPTVIKI
jgi:hypothetical protein